MDVLKNEYVSSRGSRDETDRPVGGAALLLAGLVALRWLSSWLEQGRWAYFGYHCVVFSGVIFLTHWLGP